ncbi:MAG: DUF502 domain-containing protein [Candidatus Marinimicrobia bacterium]|nr:DUF502 domain-containing protein [Candidatus Neomarinimicrobiota bacterium]MBT3617920.1 DUF502 domain-containing protein [Candidatus Neomarinimicrobiota bacterium]MBT3828757.1 DUF502 domain-containing protein [Candidatus Neomarinimicrobiota bacterium]MBT3997048.1 DUF502 domain-containing protein [Candidatus Neomarinimicrobiota bacterium]MBT4280804.1 DUF502 domain-containing protein [Candidatus Neomarinimicrobiota bacterium]
MKRTIFAGLLSVVPLVLTISILRFLFNFLDGITAPLLKSIEVNIPGLGLLLTLILIYILGLIVTNVVGKRLFSWGEKIVTSIPLIKPIYSTIKQITGAFSGASVKSFREVIFIQYPRKGLWTLAFVTNDSKAEDGSEFYHLFVPTTPNPTSGVYIILPKKDTIESDMTVEDGLKSIISGGVLAPKNNPLPSPPPDEDLNDL